MLGVVAVPVVLTVPVLVFVLDIPRLAAGSVTEFVLKSAPDVDALPGT